MRDLARTVRTFAIVAGFLAVLTGTKKADQTRDRRSGNASVKHVAIPTSEDWLVLDVDSAGIVVRIPPGATLERLKSGTDTRRGGRYVTVTMPGGYAVHFSQAPSGMDPLSVHRSIERTPQPGLAADLEDAVIIRRSDGEPFCEVTACSRPVDGSPLCTYAIGVSLQGGTVTKLTYDECLAVVAIARSIMPRP